MPALSNPHDRFFKELFTRPEVTRDFLQNYLPVDVLATIDLSTLELQPDSFVDADLQQHQSDLLCRIKLRNVEGGVHPPEADIFVYILFEHKSYLDPLTPLQLLRYMLRGWERAIRNGGRLTPIVPLVL